MKKILMITSPLFYNLLTVSYCLLENMFTSKNAKFGFIWNNSDDKFTLVVQWICFRIPKRLRMQFCFPLIGWSKISKNHSQRPLELFSQCTVPKACVKVWTTSYFLIYCNSKKCCSYSLKMLFELFSCSIFHYIAWNS